MGRRKKGISIYGDKYQQKGYVTVPRAALKFIQKGDSNEITPFEAITDLINLTTCKPSIIELGKEKVQLGENEKNISVRFLSTRWGWSRGWVRSFTDQLHSENIVNKRVETRNGKSTSIFKKSPLELPRNSPMNSPINSPRKNTDNQGVKGVSEPPKSPLKSGNSSPINSPNTNITNKYIKREQDLNNFYFKDPIGKTTYEAMMQGRIIAKKGFSKERIKDEIHKFYNHHEENSFLLQKEPYQIHNKFKNWLMGDLCKAEKPKKNKEWKRKGRIINIGVNCYSRESLLDMPLSERFDKIDALPSQFTKEAYAELISLMNTYGKTQAKRLVIDSDRITKEELFKKIIIKVQSTEVGFDQEYRKRFFYVNQNYFKQLGS